jgi:hypothetical protein
MEHTDNPKPPFSEPEIEEMTDVPHPEQPWRYEVDPASPEAAEAVAANRFMKAGQIFASLFLTPFPPCEMPYLFKIGGRPIRPDYFACDKCRSLICEIISSKL